MNASIFTPPISVNKLKCPTCGQEFREKFTLERHVKKLHKQLKTRVGELTSFDIAFEKSLVCLKGKSVTLTEDIRVFPSISAWTPNTESGLTQSHIWIHLVSMAMYSLRL